MCIILVIRNIGIDALGNDKLELKRLKTNYTLFSQKVGERERTINSHKLGLLGFFLKNIFLITRVVNGPCRVGQFSPI